MRMPIHLFRPLTSLLLVWLLVCAPLPAQSNPQDAAKPAQDPRALTKPDPKQSKKLVEQAQKEETAGALEAALADYESAARFAPLDLNIARKAAELRSKLVQGYVSSAEQLAQEGNLMGATEQMAGALRIDPSNITALQQMHQFEVLGAKDQD